MNSALVTVRRLSSWLLWKLDQPCRLGTAFRLVFCGITALLNGIKIAFQGNGNFILSGLCIGIVLGLAWSVLLLSGFSRFARNFRLSVKASLWGASWLAALTLLAVICFHLWGQ